MPSVTSASDTLPVLTKALRSVLGPRTENTIGGVSSTAFAKRHNDIDVDYPSGPTKPWERFDDLLDLVGGGYGARYEASEMRKAEKRQRTAEKQLSTLQTTTDDDGKKGRVCTLYNEPLPSARHRKCRSAKCETRAACTKLTIPFLKQYLKTKNVGFASSATKGNLVEVR